MNRRFYVTQFDFYWSLSKQGYLRFLHDGATGISWSLDLPKYEAREIKKPPLSSEQLTLQTFSRNIIKKSLNTFWKLKKTGFSAPNNARKYYEC
jgi:hypothetical protein